VENKREKRTRQIGNIEMQFRKISNAIKSISYKGDKMYNTLLSEIKQRKTGTVWENVKKMYNISGNVN